jgi:hypothetical protein
MPASSAGVLPSELCEVSHSYGISDKPLRSAFPVSEISSYFLHIAYFPIEPFHAVVVLVSAHSHMPNILNHHRFVLSALARLESGVKIKLYTYEDCVPDSNRQLSKSSRVRLADFASPGRDSAAL